VCALSQFKSLLRWLPWLLLTVPAMAQTVAPIRGFCEEGKTAVVTQGLTSFTEVQASFPGCTVTVWAANAFMVIQLPAISGSGTPGLVDYVVGTLPNDPAGNSFNIGCDPHTVAAYVSPNTGKATGLITDYGPTVCYAGGTPQYVALLDLAGILAAPRSGAHTIADASRAFVTFVATH